jgi:two-component system, OmpR family, sensor histidine kinase KdpD
VIVGYVEPHARPETQALVLGLDLLPRREVMYRGAKLLEFDLEAALAQHPQLILVDELAHTNAPGLTHAKRWQDVARLLEAGIDVYSTLNVQHLESLSDVVADVTGVTVRETVPDSVFDEADEVELVDISPDDLLERLREGKVYLPQVAQRALENYFNKGNLIALRELALRRTAERVGAQMDVFREEHAVARPWSARERLLVCVGASPFSARLVRATSRMAAGLKAPWIALHVETPADARMSDADRARLARNLALAEELGGKTATVTGHDVVEELIQYSHSRNVTKIVVGKPLQPRWKEWLHGSLVYELARRCGDLDVYVISGDAEEESANAPPPAPAPRHPAGYLWAVATVTLCTLVGFAMARFFAPANLIMVYLLGIVAMAVRFGRGPSIVASVLGVAAFDFFFVPPHLTLAVRDTEYLFTFGVMLATGVVISTLANRVKFQAESARRREQHTAALYAMSRELAAMRNREQILRAAIPQVAAACNAQAIVMLPDKDRHLAVFGGGEGFEPAEHDRGVAQWVFDHGEKAGGGTSTLPGAKGTYLPLLASGQAVGVLGVLLADSQAAADPERMQLLDAFAGLIALAVERANLATEAQRIGLQMETERLRSSLLSTVSHDLRTPLSAITGASSTLLEADPAISAETRRELVSSIFDEAERLHRLVTNLLDMTRLEAGALVPRKEWQPVEEVVGAALQRMARVLGEHPLTTRIAADLPFVPLDDLLIQQVLVNLLENAVKYAPPRTAIEIRAYAEGSGVVLEVADHGPGLPPEDLERVFEKFYRSPGAGARSGAGLGLAICRGIVELHGGRIWAENLPESGVAFRFSLPATGPPPQMPPLEPAPSEHSGEAAPSLEEPR